MTPDRDDSQVQQGRWYAEKVATCHPGVAQFLVYVAALEAEVARLQAEDVLPSNYDDHGAQREVDAKHLGY